ncbi:hypothetical protein GCM10010517_59360 [Streptosporangium fragile]|uniref:ATPase dynein-related AAA domain-containing protein n=1 Tax=Streptosporangium fragile TaxID=46186 RepID=A0ABN3W4C2_9ACTN
MSKRSRRSGSTRQNNGTSVARKTEALKTLLERARQADPAEVEAVMTAEGVPAADMTAMTIEPADVTRLGEVLDALDMQRLAYQKCATAASERERQAEETRKSLEEERRSLAGERQNLADQQTKIQKTSLALAAREDQLRALEQDAEEGFVAAAANAHQALTTELTRRRDDFDRRLQEEADALRDDHRRRLARLDEDRVELQAARDTLKAEQAELRAALAEARRTQIAGERRDAAIEAEVAARAAAEIAAVQVELHTTTVRADAAEQLVGELSARLRRLESDWERYGIEDPSHILDQLHAVKEANRDLRDKLAARLDDDTLDRLRRLEQQNRELNAERERLGYELEELRGQALANRISNLQIKQLADAEQHFAILERGYQTRIGELRASVEELYRDRPDPTSPLFPNCVAMDDDDELNEEGVLVDEAPDLAELALALQAKMFTGSDRAYRLNDVCATLGGMHMSRLHLLEGISGIGKTSLPKALARALGTDCVVIEVQAGWRDRHDLIGHYNTFEKRFDESEFLQAIYRAQTPRFRHRPYFIVLDEMNLSRPEQYFSVFLSKLENNDGKPIQLAPTGLGRQPNWMVGGKAIHLPDNIWFVGTANQDESTLEFADKTYNRSFVLELPAVRPWVPRLAAHAAQPYSVTALDQAFRGARKTHAEAGTKAREFVKSLRNDLYEFGRVQLGSRVEKQLERYVPVVVAAGAGQQQDDSGQDGLAFAIDQFLSSKVLRQLRTRFEVTVEHVKKIEASLLNEWDNGGMSGMPERSMRTLEDARRRLDG